jgi:hypothetical protein
MTGGLLLIAIFASVVALAAIIGAALPVRHHVTCKAHFRKTPEEVYAAISQPGPWRSDLTGWGPLPDRDGHKQWWEENRRGQKVVCELVEDARPSRRVVRAASENRSFAGTWTFEISPAGESGSDLRIHEDGEIHKPLFRLLARFFFGYTGNIERFLKDLAAKFDEQVRIEE